MIIKLKNQQTKTFPKLTQYQNVLKEFNGSWNLCVKVSVYDTVPMRTFK